MHYINIFYPLKRQYIIFLIFFLGCFIKIIPELVAYPFPIGYDVVNYYIPSILYFEELNFEKFHIYVTLLYILYTTFHLSAQDTVIILSSICYGLLSVMLYLWSQRFYLSKIQGLFMTIFVIFQISMLRTGWDLHKDIFAIVIMLLVFYIITYKNRDSLINLFLILSLTVLTLFVDIMISFLTFVTLIIYCTIHKKWIYLSSIIAITSITLTIILISNPHNTNPIISNINKLINENFTIDIRYSQINMVLLFIKINLLNLPTFIIGLRYLKSSIFYISTIIVLMGSMSWIVLPNTNLLLPDRWIILSGLFLSIFSFFGLISLIYKSQKLRNHIMFSVILSFLIIIGLAYMVMPNNQPFPIYAVFREHTDFFIPASMQTNVVDIDHNQDLLTAIEWINKNTQSNATIYGENHLKGWMKVTLKGNRTFDTYNNNMVNKEVIYLIDHKIKNQINQDVDILFTKGNFNIIKNLYSMNSVNNLTKMK